MNLLQLQLPPHTVAVEDWPGPDPAALLLHSSGLSGLQWRRLAQSLSPLRRALVPDLIGYGRTAPWRADAFDWTEDLAIAVALLDRCDAPVDLIGHSYGGFLAVHAARARPASVRRLVLFEPVLWGLLYEEGDPAMIADFEAINRDGLLTDPAQAGTEAWAARFVDFWSGPGAFAAMSPARRAALMGGAPKLSQEILSVIRDRAVAAALAPIQAPALVLSGRRSPACARRVAALTARALPNARLVEIDAAHMAPVTEPDRVNPLILDFIE
jgi:pimeloyl-ACP methyl ester carboxylesterase